MKRGLPLALAISILGASYAPTMAMTGATQSGSPAQNAIVMLLKSDARGSSFCTAVVIAPDVLITAAHCVKPPAELLAYWPGGRLDQMPRAEKIAIHPQYRADAPKTRERSIDVALVQLSAPVARPYTPIEIDYQPKISVGTPFLVSGYGVSIEKDGRTGGTLRSAQLVTREPLSKLLIWAKDSQSHQTGACTGDSGGPFISPEGKLVGIIVWSQGAGNKACGELTQALRLDAVSDFIQTTLRNWSR